MKRLFSVALLAAIVLGVGAAPAFAHAVLESSSPSKGTRTESLNSIELEFSERIDVGLSQVQVLSTDGASIATAEPTLTSSGTVLTVPLAQEPPAGTYLVTWRVFSDVDGHVTAGAFAIGLRVEPAPIEVPEQKAPGVSPISVLGRALFLLGFLLALGAVTVELLSPLAVRPLSRIAFFATLAALAGVAILGHQQRVDSGGPISAFLKTSIGSAIMIRAGLLALCAAAVFMWRKKMRARRGFAILAGASLVATAWVHASNGHAGVGGVPQIALQAVHMLALGAWVGGFVPLLAAIERGNARRVARRFSTLAIICVVVVIVTGQVRAFNELPDLTAFTTTGYGRVLIAKWLLLLGVLGLAVGNRRRNVKLVGEDPLPLRTAVRREASISVVIVILAALLANIAPRSAKAESSMESGPISVTRTSFAEDLEATLKATPGTAGPNTIELSLQALPDRTPLTEAQVRLALRYRGRPGVEPQKIELSETAPGSYQGEAVLVPAGPYEATLLVQQAQGSSQVVLPLATRSEQRITELGGSPRISSVELDSGVSVQMYLDPDQPGANEFHATYFDSDGTELAVEDVVVVASGPDGIRPLTVRALTPGHVVADAFLSPGSWRFDVSALIDGEPVAVWITRELA